MSASLLLNVVMIAADRKPDWDAVRAVITALGDDRVEDFKDISESDDETGEPQGLTPQEMRDLLNADIELLADAMAHGHQELVILNVKDVLIYLAGGTSYGDYPGELMLAMERLELAGSLRAGGMNLGEDG